MTKAWKLAHGFSNIARPAWTTPRIWKMQGRYAGLTGDLKADSRAAGAYPCPASAKKHQEAA